MKNLILNIEQNKELLKRLNAEQHYSIDQFIKDGKEYVSAIKQGRTFCTIPHVSKSGMSRVIKYTTCQRSNGRFYYRNYICFMRCLGYSENKSYWGGFNIGGCGMDMNFATNYNIIHKLHRLGFITKKSCDSLAQQTPSVI